jgi:hypothetical protein
MLTCRSISPAAWAHARDALVFYFSRRHGFANAEDLAHDTLAALLSRADFEFGKEDDFLRVCYAFAVHVSQAGYRKAKKHSADALDPALHGIPRWNAGPGVNGLNATEISLLLDEVIRIGETELRVQDWTAICHAASADGHATGIQDSPAKGTRSRVRLFRARQKLARLTSWKKNAT